MQLVEPMILTETILILAFFLSFLALFQYHCSGKRNKKVGWLRN